MAGRNGRLVPVLWYHVPPRPQLRLRPAQQGSGAGSSAGGAIGAVERFQQARGLFSGNGLILDETEDFERFFREVR